jgi:hypothetical protein
LVRILEQALLATDAAVGHAIELDHIRALTDAEVEDAVDAAAQNIKIQMRKELAAMREEGSRSALETDKLNAPLENADKLNAPAKDMIFGDDDAYSGGLSAMILPHMLQHSIEKECTQNDEEKWAEEYYYVTRQPSVEVVVPEKNNQVRDKGHAGYTLQQYCAMKEVNAANLTEADVVVLRLYTGPFYRPWNNALRFAHIDNAGVKQWATCIAVLYSAVLKLMKTASPTKVFRGLDESGGFVLPSTFLRPKAGEFAGGVELGFSSTTEDYQVALEYSGGLISKGTIMQLEFDKASRGADIQFLSQYPEEKEWLWPPCTSITCLPDTVRKDGAKTIVKVRATVHPNPPDVSAICSCTDIVFKEFPEWRKAVVIEKTDFPLSTTDADVFQWLGTVKAQAVKNIDLENTQVTNAGAAVLAKECSSLQRVDLKDTQISDTGAIALADGCSSLQRVYLDNTQVSNTGVIALARRCSGLQNIGLANTQVTDDGVIALAGCVSLQKIYLGGTQVTDAGVAVLASGCGSLTGVYLANTQVTDASATALVNGCSSLQEMVLDNTQVMPKYRKWCNRADIDELRRTWPTCRSPTRSSTTAQPRSPTSPHPPRFSWVTRRSPPRSADGMASEGGGERQTPPRI